MKEKALSAFVLTYGISVWLKLLFIAYGYLNPFFRFQDKACELLSYIALAFLAADIYKQLAERTENILKRIMYSAAISVLCVSLVFLLNNFLKYLDVKSMRFPDNWTDITSFPSIMKSDLIYSKKTVPNRYCLALIGEMLMCPGYKTASDYLQLIINNKDNKEV